MFTTRYGRLIVTVNYFIYLFLGCYRIPHPMSDGLDFCHFVKDMKDRPSNKNQVITDNIIGSTVISGTGAIAATQIGLCV
jgi:hypothetical protein